MVSTSLDLYLGPACLAEFETMLLSMYSTCACISIIRLLRSVLLRTTVTLTINYIISLSEAFVRVRI